jgi:hypothetical protein
VFCRVDGQPLNPATVSRNFAALVRASGLPKITLFGVRHSWATLALLEAIPAKIVAEILGHSSTRVTEDVYQTRDARNAGLRRDPGRSAFAGRPLEDPLEDRAQLKKPALVRARKPRSGVCRRGDLNPHALAGTSPSILSDPSK